MKKLLTVLLSFTIFFTLIGCEDTENTSQYSITFETNGGTEVDTVSVEEGASFTEPTAPEKEGYSFLGWFSDSTLNAPYDFSNPVVGDLTLYAKFEINDYNIFYESNGGTTINSEVHHYGDTLVIPDDPLKEMAMFEGWYTDSNLTILFAFDTMPASDLTLYAKWTELYTVSFEENGGNQIENVHYVEGEQIDVPSNPIRTGYTFLGWYLDENLSNPYTDMMMPSENVTLYASWEINTYEVTFYNHLGEIIEVREFEYRELITFPTITYGDLVFVDWFETITFDIPFTDSIMPASDISIYGYWTHLDVVLRANMSNSPMTLNPVLAGSYLEGDIITHLFEGLVRERAGIVTPGIAEAWEVSADGLAVTFHLRESTWSDGTPLTAHDFRDSWLFAMHPESNSQYSWIWEYTNVVGVTDYMYNNGSSENVGIQVIDDYTLLVELTEPTHYFVSLMSFYHFMPTKDFTSVWMNNPTTMVTNGAFTVEDYAPDSYLILEKNMNYWNAEGIDIDTYEITFLPSTTAYSYYLSGDLDILYNMPTAEIPQLIATSNEFHRYPLLGTYYYSFNLDMDNNGLNDTGIWNNQNLRYALALAVDREAICDLLGAGQIPAVGMLPAGFINHEGNDFMLTSNAYQLPTDDSGFVDAVNYFELAALEMYPNASSTAEAVDQLRLALENEQLLYNTSAGHQLIAEMLQAEWSAVLGFNIPLANQEWAIFQQTRINGDFSLARGGWLTDYLDPEGMLAIFEEDNYYNFHNYFSADFNYFMQQSVSVDVATHFEYLEDAYVALMNDMPTIPIYHYSDTILVRSYVHNWNRSALGSYDFTQATIQ